MMTESKVRLRSKFSEAGLMKFKNKISTSLKNCEPATLNQWFVKQVLPYDDLHVEKLDILETSVQQILYIHKQPKYLNAIFLQDESLLYILNNCDSLVEMGFILKQHMERKIKKTEIKYDKLIYDGLKNQVIGLFKKRPTEIDILLKTIHVDNFLSQKEISPNSPFELADYMKENNEKQIILIFNYIIKPLFEQTTITNIYKELEEIVKWYIVIEDDTPQKQRMLIELTRKLEIFLMSKKTILNQHFVGIFIKICDMLSVKYFRQDCFSFKTLSPLCNLLNFGDIPFDEMINNWVSFQKKDNLPKKIQNIFKNVLQSGSSIFSFYIIMRFSLLLKAKRDYETMFHLYDTFFKKDFLTLKLHNKSFLSYYIQILTMYMVGFINRDRLDGETELDVLTDNLQTMLFKNKFSFNGNYKQIIMFYKIYENRFQCLTPCSRKFVRNLQIAYNYQVGSDEIYREIERNIFNDFSADYDDESLHILQRSDRYLGLQNLGNTCYINSFMQALFMTKKFKTLIMRTKDSGAIQSSKIKFHTLIKLFTQLDEKGYSRKQEIWPSYFKQQVPQPFCSSWEQHDSGQFGRMYFDMILQEVKGTQLEEKLERLFNNKVKHIIICEKCKSERQMTQKVFDFILHFNEQSTDVLTVSDILRNNFKSFQLDKDNALFCQKCKKKTPTINTIQPLEFASHLIVTISIFKFEGISSSKITTPINLQFTLNTRSISPKFSGENITYQLYAFIVHIGTGVEKGHYKCFARNLQENPMVWYQFDDHYVTEKQITRFQDFRFGERQNPYILFYCVNNKGNRKSIN